VARVRVRAGLVRDPATGRYHVLEDEDSWLTWVRDACHRHRWRTYHTLRSTGSEAGFPDLVAVRPPRLLFVELKTDSPRSQLSSAQREWADDLEAVADEVALYHPDGRRLLEWYVWRPRDRDLITAVLA